MVCAQLCVEGGGGLSIVAGLQHQWSTQPTSLAWQYLPLPLPPTQPTLIPISLGDFEAPLVALCFATATPLVQPVRKLSLTYHC